MTIYSVRLTRIAKKNLMTVPPHIVRQFKRWLEAVETDGIHEVRKTQSFHDELLQGKRFGQRSIRLNKSYRAFYIERKNDAVKWIEILEVNKHDY